MMGKKEKLGELVRGVSLRILFLRHAETKVGPRNDWERMLSDAGMSQSKRAGESFGRALQPFCNVVMSSPAPRCLDTIDHFFKGVSQEVRSMRIVTDPTLYDGTIQPGASEVFKRLGYQSLSTYLKDGGATSALEKYADDVVDQLINLLESSDNENKEDGQKIQPLKDKDQYQTLLFCGHAVYLPAAGRLCAQLLGAPKHALRILTDSNMRPCEAFLLVPSLLKASASNNSTEDTCQVRLFGFDDEEYNDTFHM
uniref:Uncharacterized protein n=1 Tax=Aureoumbra lagunensis TaxID=44058 RepID=A0A7S3NN62_9STRA|mmetsp:Transcript_7971/g.12123  ORF Transcript_7971/g.12123 Transcript_7971/m.12123 type:complete len:254 (-) Transcript_7971:1353-2114(-)